MPKSITVLLVQIYFFFCMSASAGSQRQDSDLREFIQQLGAEELIAIDDFVEENDLDNGDEAGDYDEYIVSADELDELSRRGTPEMEILDIIEENFEYDSSEQDDSEPTDFKTTPIHFAAMKDCPSVIEKYEANTAFFNAQDIYGDTALHYAVSEGHICSIFALLRRGACPLIQNIQKLSPLDSARERCLYAVVELMKNSLSKSEKIAKEWDFIQSFNAPSTERDIALPFGWTHLHKAAMEGYSVATAYLLENGFDIDGQDDSGRTPLHYACRNSNFGLTVELLQSCANANVPDFRGVPPLYYAVTNKCQASVEKLILHGAQLDFVDEQGKTVLHHAALLGATAITRMLLENGAPVNSVDHQGSTAAELIEDYSYPYISQMLKKSKR